MVVGATNWPSVCLAVFVYLTLCLFPLLSLFLSLSLTQSLAQSTNLSLLASLPSILPDMFTFIVIAI